MKNGNVYFVIPKIDLGRTVSLYGVAAPTAPTYLYSFAKAMNFGIYKNGRCVDFAIHNQEAFLSELSRDDLVCVTATVANYRNAVAFIKKVKECGSLCAIGGPWATVKGVQIQKHQPLIDYIVRGEGESALMDILSGSAKRGIIDKVPIPMPKLPPIDLSGWSDEDLYTYYDNYVAMLKTGIYGAVPDVIPVFAFYQSARGCIQKPRCGFCGSRLGDVYIARTRTQIISDIKVLSDRLSKICRYVHIFDCSDSFTTGVRKLKGCKNLPNVTMTVYARTDEINPVTVKILRDFGVRKVSIGIETGSIRMMENIGKGTTMEMNLEAAALLKRYGLSMYANLMYGIPNETPDDLEKTVEHFSKLVEVGNIYRVAGRIVTPLPNARWYFDMLKKIEASDPELAKKIHESDFFDPQKLQKIWLEKMTHLKMKDIKNAHKKIVRIAKEAGASVSSEVPRGLV